MSEHTQVTHKTLRCRLNIRPDQGRWCCNVLDINMKDTTTTTTTKRLQCTICYPSFNLNSLFKNDSSLTPGSEIHYRKTLRHAAAKNPENMWTAFAAKWGLLLIFPRTEAQFKDVTEQLSFNLEVSFLQALVALLLSCKFSSVLRFGNRGETIYCLNGFL